MAHDESEQRLAGRRAAAAFSARVEDRFGVFFRAAASEADFGERAQHVLPELTDLAVASVEEHQGGHAQSLVDAVLATYMPAPRESKTASLTKEAKPRMCPFHKDVVDISLAAGDPAAGFNALQSQWGGARHCEGDGYKGESCRFKPQMTTQAFWDERKEKAEEKRRQKAERAELDESQPVTEVDPDAAAESVPDDAPVETPEAEGADVIDFPAQDAPEAAEVPMSMAAHTAGFRLSENLAGLTKEAPGNQHLPGASDKRQRQYEHIKAQCLADGGSEEHCKELAARTVNKQRAEHGETKSHIATETTGLGGPEPKMDKRKWTPQTVQKVEADDPNGRNPTVRKDILVPGITNDAVNGDPKEIGEKGMLERQNIDKATPVNRETGPTQWTGTDGQAKPVTSADHITERCPKCNSGTTGMIDEEQARCHACGNIWKPGAVIDKSPTMSSVDPNSNPIIDMMNRDDDFVPDHLAARAILAHKQR